MPFTKEQAKEYWHQNKAILNQKRREKRRLAKLGLATGEVSREIQVSHLEVSHQAANPTKVSHGKPENGKPNMANPKLTQLIKQYQTNTNYSCAPGCNEDRYCSNCWYFADGELVNYKEVSR